MQIDKNLQFISSKIVELQAARFYCTTNGLLKISPTVINTYKVSDNGEILFFLPRPTQLVSQFDKDFNVELNYFRKGAYSYLNIFGKARIVNDPEELFEYELTQLEIERALRKDILVVVKVLKADYHVSEPETKHSVLRSLRTITAGLWAWVEPNTRSFDFSKPQLPNYGF
jgi:general stress protein 26